MKIHLLILALSALGCNSNQQPTKQKEHVSLSDNCFVYPRAVDSLQVKDLFDSARWYVYTWHCEQSYLPKSDGLKSITFGELPLKFNSLALRQDTIDINFDFIDDSEPYPILTSMMRKHKELVTGVGFSMKTRQRVYMLSPSGFSTTEKGPATRYENPLQPEVLSYIQSSWNKLDDCFKKLVEQKGIKQ